MWRQEMNVKTHQCQSKKKHGEGFLTLLVMTSGFFDWIFKDLNIKVSFNTYYRLFVYVIHGHLKQTTILAAWGIVRGPYKGSRPSIFSISPLKQFKLEIV